MELGQRVQFDVVFERRDLPLDDRYIRGRWGKFWQRVAQSGEGVYAGYRTCHDGYVRNLGEDGREWVSTGHHQYAIVYTHERKAPIRVPFDAIRVVE